MMTAIRLVFRKFMALGLLAALIAGLAFGFFWPSLERLRDADDKILNARLLLGRLSAGATDSGARQQAANDIEALYLPGETDAIRLAGLQSTLGDTAKSHNIKLASLSTSESADRNGIRMLGVRTQFTTELEPLQRLLYDLEQKQRSLVIEQLSIARTPSSTAMPSASLDVSFTVLGAAPAKEN